MNNDAPTLDAQQADYVASLLDQLRIEAAQERERRIAAEELLRGQLVLDTHTPDCLRHTKILNLLGGLESLGEQAGCTYGCRNIRTFLGLDAQEPSAGTEAAT